MRMLIMAGLVASVALTAMVAGCSQTQPVAATPKMTSLYTVGTDDRTFQDVAKKVYGDSDQWKRIADANPQVSGGELKVGQELTIPPIKTPEGKVDMPQGCRRADIY